MIVRGAAVIFRRELGAFFLSPVGAVVGGAFLAVQGIAFWGLVRVLANPVAPAPYGAVLSTFFGGTTIYWAVVFALAGLLTMRLYAEERRTGTWEALCTAGVSDAAIALGKAAAAYVTYLALWVPTVSFVAVVFLFAPADAGIEIGPVIGAYLGVAVVGAALVSLGALTSALTDKQIVAALSSFAIAMAALLVGEIAGLGLNARADAEAFAAGLVRPGTVARYLGVAIGAQLFTYAAIAVGRRPRREVALRAGLAALVAASLAALCVLAARAEPIDLTGAKIHSLEPETLAVLSRVASPVEVLVVTPTIPGFAAVFDAVGGVLERMRETQPRLSIRRVDPASKKAALSEVAREFGVTISQLTEGGAVVFASAGRSRLLDVTAVADFEGDPLGAGQAASFWAESAFAQAIAEISDDRVHTLCEADGVGGLPLGAASDAGLDWRAVAEILRRDGVVIRRVVLEDGLEGCDALALVGPVDPIAPAAALALAAYLKAGGSALFAARSELARTPAIGGLELIFEEAGAAIHGSVVVDPSSEEGIANLWSTSRGYGDHPISRPFLRRRVKTAWPAPRRVSGQVALVFASGAGWAETDVGGVFGGGGEIEASAAEREIGVAVAAASEKSGSRVVVLGSAEAAATQFVAQGLGAGHILAARAIGWLLGRDVEVAVSDKRPEHVRLVMSSAARRVTFVIVVVCVPIAWLAFFALLVWRRQRD